MAINVNTVYQTVLLIINKEQRGYITPDEFNKTATQVQLDIFEQYFDSLNQQIRVPQTNFDYSNRQTNIDNKISQFKCFGNCSYSAGNFNLPTIDINTGRNIVYSGEAASNEFSFYTLGDPVYTGGTYDADMQRAQRNNIYKILKSDLASPSNEYPVYIYENNKIKVYPLSIVSGVSTSFLRKPLNVKWAFTVGAQGQYIYDPSSNSQNFELESSEQVNVILRILQYSGIIIRDTQIVQAAAAEIQQNEVNSKS
jgi:hypothetical protein